MKRNEKLDAYVQQQAAAALREDILFVFYAHGFFVRTIGGKLCITDGHMAAVPVRSLLMRTDEEEEQP